VSAAASVSVTIPMEGSVESLNAAVAGALVAFEAARQRRTASRVAPSDG
jgi:TrmH family RNA methyltransferase